MAVASESAGLGICYIGAIRNDAARAAELLELSQQVCPVFGMYIGWPGQDPRVKPHISVSVILNENRCSVDGEAEAIAPYDKEMRKY